MASRDLDDLLPRVKLMAAAFLLGCEKAGVSVLIYCTYRSDDEQAELYAQGRTKPGKIVTNARPGQSAHNTREAFDFVPMIGGKPQWDNPALYTKCGAIAESVGLTWSGRWSGKLKEMAHCEHRKG